MTDAERKAFNREQATLLLNQHQALNPLCACGEPAACTASVLSYVPENRGEFLARELAILVRPLLV